MLLNEIQVLVFIISEKKCFWRRKTEGNMVTRIRNLKSAVSTCAEINIAKCGDKKNLAAPEGNSGTTVLSKHTGIV